MSEEFKHKLGFILERVFQELDTFWYKIDPAKRPLELLGYSLILCIYSLVCSLLPIWASLLISSIWLILTIASCFELKPRRWDGTSSWLSFEFAVRTRGFLAYLGVSAALSGYFGWEYQDTIIPHLICAAYPLGIAMGIVGLVFQAQVLEATDPRFQKYQRVSRYED